MVVEIVVVELHIFTKATVNFTVFILATRLRTGT